MAEPAAPVAGLQTAAGDASLGSYEELGTRRGCTCRPEGLRLRSDQGELVHPRGGCVNKCEHCAMRAGYENLEMLVQDAMQGDAPTALLVTNTRTATLDMDAFREARRQLVRACRHRWPAFQYAYQVEYTTGYGPRSGGQRRPHWNWLVKGVPDDQVDELRELVRVAWCKHADAEPRQQYAEALRSPVAALKYVVKHFSKTDQRPPEGFRGQRFNASRGYFGAITVTTARARAREIQARKGEIAKAEKAGQGPHDAELTAELALRRQAATRWVLTTASGARLSREVMPDRTLTDRLRIAVRGPT
jgi:hypothetical protein